MRRLVPFAMALLPAIPLLMGGCEDGPNQTYSPAPAGAGGIWNGSNGAGGLGDGGSNTPTGTQNYDASFGGTNANDLCTADQEKLIWNQLFQEPIALPGLAAGIDAAGGYNADCASGWTDPSWKYDPTKESWTNCTVEQAEKILCQGTADSIYYGITTTLGWGENDEFSVLYNGNNRIITDELFEYGYPGAIIATTSDGKTTYNITLNNVEMTKSVNGGAPQNVVLDWTNPGTLDPIVNSLYDALLATYGSGVQPDPNCATDGVCIIGNNGDQGGYFWFTTLGLAIFVDSTIGSPAVASTWQLVDLMVLKELPFSSSDVLMQLDSGGVGPTATTDKPGGTIGNQGTCVYHLGQTYKDFSSSCVQVYTSPQDPNATNDNLVQYHKLIGGMGHSDEAFAFDILGIDPNFVASSLPDNKVIGDTDVPTDTDTAYEFDIDQNIQGALVNDYKNNDSSQAQDWHGLGLLTLEWANLVQEYMTANHGVNTQLGDPACLANPAAPGAGKVCSGVEGIVTSAPVASAPLPVNALGSSALAIPYAAPFAAGLKPGTWYSLFCSDGKGLTPSGNPNGYQNCVGGTQGFPTPDGNQAAYYFDTMQKAVALSFGNNPVPADVASRRFYFKEWIFALVKYLQSANDPAATLAAIDANPVDEDNLFFDSAGGGFETAEYVFRNYVNSFNQAPLDIAITTNLTTSVVNNFSFSRYNFRGEKALYTALQTDPTDKPGAEPLYLTNIVGSPVLVNTYQTYACAINTDPSQCGGVTAPLDPLTGDPEWNGYEPAFGQSFLNLAANGNPPLASPMAVATTDYALIQSAMVTIPIWSNPYDPTSATATDKTTSALIPFIPLGAETGILVTVDGSRDKFYNTNELYFDGISFSGIIDWEYVPVATDDGGSDNQMVIRGVEASDYLGLVPFCAEPNAAGDNIDVLAIRMYQDGQTILDWINSHPNSKTDCGIQIKYSIYGNYADYITSLANGVRVSLNAGFGGSVVADMVMFDPNIVPTLGQ